MKRGPRLSRGGLTSVIVALTCVALSAAGLRLSETAGTDHQFIRGRVGDTVAIDGGLVTVGDVRVGTALKSNNQIRDRTTGMFVVVHVDAEATGTEEAHPAVGASLARRRPELRHLRRAGGCRRRDRLRGVDRCDLRGGSGADRRPDPELYETEFVSGYQQRLRIHLGITPGNADRWRAAAKDQACCRPTRAPGRCRRSRSGCAGSSS